MPTAFGARCEVCQSHRVHFFPVRLNGVTGQKVRDRMTCTVCETTTAIDPSKAPGICCPRCGDVRMNCGETRVRSHGSERRKRKCFHCGFVVVTVERVTTGAG